MAIRWRSVRPGFTRRFTIYDDEDQLAIIKSAYRTLGLDEKEFMQYRAALSSISHAKNTRSRRRRIFTRTRSTRTSEASP